MEEEEARGDKRPKQGQNRAYSRKKPCKSRIDELAVPAKRLMLNLYQEHAYHFEKERKRNVLRAVQELYSMTPEQAEVYFNKKNQELKEMLKRKKARKKQAEACRKKAEKEDRDKAYLVFFQFLIMGFWYARSHEVPPLVTTRLRKLSDVILKQICQLRGVDVPKRSTKDEVSKHLVMLADWIAVSMEQIYFESQIVVNKELDEMEEEVLKVIDLQQQEQKKTQSSPSAAPAQSSSSPPPVAAGAASSGSGILSKEVVVEEPELASETSDVDE